ncbi:hypothetical protein C8J56DRAFT_957835 [Mycena floridula]|nr:hypothetical protein C8J56DRAFT_957835 [Mycena floridula]
MQKFQNSARTLLRSSWAQHARLLSTTVPQAGSSKVAVQKQTGKTFIDPTTVRNHFQRFGEISRIWSGSTDSTITFASPEQAQNLLDTATDGQVTTESGETYYIKPLAQNPAPPPSTYLQVTTFDQNTKDTDIQAAFSNFGSIESVTLLHERPAIGEMLYSAQFIVHFTNIKDADKAGSTLVSLPNGALLQTSVASKEYLDPTAVLQFLVEKPWNKMQPNYTAELFVNDLSRLANIPREDLDHRIVRGAGLGLITMLLKTKTVEDAQKVKAIRSDGGLPVTFAVEGYRSNDLPPKKRKYSEKARETKSKKIEE